MKIIQILPNDTVRWKEIDSLLESEGIKRDAHLNYTCALLDDNEKIIATGSAFGTTLRCLAIASEHQGKGLLKKIVHHLKEHLAQEGKHDIFLYTKPTAAPYFGSEGFTEVARAEGKIVFMESKTKGFNDFLNTLAADTAKNNLAVRVHKEKGDNARIAAIVMNANPFTKGHLHLIKTAASNSDILHLFIVTEDTSLVPYDVRRNLIELGTQDIKNLVYHDTGDYIVSQATFPSYFLKDSETVSRNHALLDVAVFAKIAQHLGINCRYVGEEPKSGVTRLYNQVMLENLPKAGVEMHIIPRIETDGEVISASAVRAAIKEGNFDILENYLPPTSLAYFRSEQAKSTIDRITSATEVIHH